MGHDLDEEIELLEERKVTREQAIFNEIERLKRTEEKLNRKLRNRTLILSCTIILLLLAFLVLWTPLGEVIPLATSETNNEKIVKPEATLSKPLTPSILYRVQIGAFRNRHNHLDHQMDILGLRMEIENGWFKYYHGDFDDYEMAHQVFTEQSSSGYPDAFMIPLHNNRKITWKEHNALTAKSL